jgi:hypothetical protein
MSSEWTGGYVNPWQSWFNFRHISHFARGNQESREKLQWRFAVCRAGKSAVAADLVVMRYAIIRSGVKISPRTRFVEVFVLGVKKVCFLIIFRSLTDHHNIWWHKVYHQRYSNITACIFISGNISWCLHCAFCIIYYLYQQMHSILTIKSVSYNTPTCFDIFTSASSGSLFSYTLKLQYQ